MGFDKESAYILLLCSLPFQYNVFSDSMNKMINGMKGGWKTKTELTENENYFLDKITSYFGIVFSIVFIFIYYRVRKMRSIISIIFFCSAVTWLLYMAVDEDKMFILYIIKALQGIYCSGLQVAHFSYIMHFANDNMKCFYGSLTQFSMFIGLFIENLIFTFLDWKSAAIIFFVESVIFGGLIWLVPEYHVKPKSVTREYIYRKDNLKLLIISIVSMAIQLLSAIGVLLNSLSEMLEGVGLSLSGPTQSCLFDFVGALAGLISAFITDPIGPKYMFAISALGLCVGLLMYAIQLKVKSPNWVGALSVFVYFLFYGLGMGPIPWYLFSILVPEGCRIESTAIGVCSNLFIPPILDKLWDTLNKKSGQFGSSIFGAVDCVFAIIFGLVFIPVERDTEEYNVNIL